MRLATQLQIVTIQQLQHRLRFFLKEYVCCSSRLRIYLILFEIFLTRSVAIVHHPNDADMVFGNDQSGGIIILRSHFHSISTKQCSELDKLEYDRHHHSLVYWVYRLLYWCMWFSHFCRLVWIHWIRYILLENREIRASICHSDFMIDIFVLAIPLPSVRQPAPYISPWRRYSGH